ncbi:MAG: hypothetical protein WC791_02930 [Candidatus Paceibacterota bacterium]
MGDILDKYKIHMSSEMRKKIIFIVVIMVLLAGTMLWGSKGDMSAWGKADNSWYVVYLNNNQVYFGHIAKIDDGVLTLKDAHYAEQVEVPAQVSTSKNFAIEQAPQKTFKLTAKGSDTMLTSDHTIYLNRTSVSSWEKLSPEAEVAKMLAGTKNGI